jgi:trk system potassium uptake protein TrkH
MRYRPAALTVTAFLTLIVAGAIVLHGAGVGLSAHASRPLSSAFTALSAVCVTGLSVVDLSREFDFRGQLLVLVLIQTSPLTPVPE